MKRARKEIVTSRGYTVRVLGISPLLLQEVYAANAAPEPPTYTVMTVTGVEEEHALDADSLHTDARKAAWTAYQAAVRTADALREERIIELFLSEGIEVDMPDAAGLEAWAKRLARFGVQTPDDGDERRWAWLRREVIGSADDLMAITGAVMEQSGVGPAVMRRAESMFRREVRDATAGDVGAEAGQMDHEPDGGGDDGGQGVGDRAAEPAV